MTWLSPVFGTSPLSAGIRTSSSALRSASAERPRRRHHDVGVTRQWRIASATVDGDNDPCPDKVVRMGSEALRTRWIQACCANAGDRRADEVEQWQLTTLVS